ncbi:hypothetical protein DY000_02039579 [Brassica cretica]|uniref:Uncharacterized protein n=1 Tax=Brassica cretica TaxID=69181 RepID=A0ABQ7BE24_BRACR|nr:hypothetical protein DY000_02039579 [Brassica cretica]
MEYFREVINSTKGRKGKSKPPLGGVYKEVEVEEIANFVGVVASSFPSLSAFAASDSDLFLGEFLLFDPKDVLFFLIHGVISSGFCPDVFPVRFPVYPTESQNRVFFHGFWWLHTEGRPCRGNLLKLAERHGVSISVDRGDVCCRSLVNVVAGSGAIASLLIVLIVYRRADQAFCGCELD